MGEFYKLLDEMVNKIDGKLSALVKDAEALREKYADSDDKSEWHRLNGVATGIVKAQTVVLRHRSDNQ